MGDKPGHYWDLREARWVKFEPPVVELPEQAEPVDDRLRAEHDDSRRAEHDDSWRAEHDDSRRAEHDDQVAAP